MAILRGNLVHAYHNDHERFIEGLFDYNIMLYEELVRQGPRIADREYADWYAKRRTLFKLFESDNMRQIEWKWCEDIRSIPSQTLNRLKEDGWIINPRMKTLSQ